MVLHKKAQENLMKIILAVALIAIILFVAAPALISVFENKFDRDACRISVIAADRTRGSYAETGPLSVGLECETYFDKKTEKTEDAEGAMLQVSDMIHDCWYAFGEGNYNVFEGRMSETNAHCFICTKFNMPKDVKVTQLDLDTYVKDQENTYKNEKASYYEYFGEGLFLEPDDILDRARGSFETLDAVMSFLTIDESNKDEIYFVEELELPNPTEIDTLTNALNSLKGWGLDEESWIVGGAIGDLRTALDVRDVLLRGSTIETFDSLEHSKNPRQNDPYAIVFYQISNEYWKQMYLSRISAGLVLPDVFEVPPAKVFITRYETIGTDKFDCELLQG